MYLIQLFNVTFIIQLKKEDEAMKLEEIEEEEEIYEINQKRDFHVPHYTKIYGWDKVGKI